MLVQSHGRKRADGPFTRTQVASFVRASSTCRTRALRLGVPSWRCSTLGTPSRAFSTSVKGGPGQHVSHGAKKKGNRKPSTFRVVAVGSSTSNQSSNGVLSRSEEHT